MEDLRIAGKTISIVAVTAIYIAIWVRWYNTVSYIKSVCTINWKCLSNKIMLILCWAWAIANVVAVILFSLWGWGVL